MRKFELLLVTLSLLYVASGTAAPVTPSKALDEATAFVATRGGTPRPLRMASQAQRLQAAADAGYYYVYNIGSDGGFVIVSGDDRTNPILGYSDEGTFDATRVPANMQNWLDGYVEQLIALDAMSDAQAAKLLAAPRRATTVATRNSIAPMVTTRWDQASPYWNECPEFMSVDEYGDTIGELAYAGCVAVAMAQIMKYHNWPERTTQVIPAYTFSYPNGDYTYSSVEMEELPITTFDWAHMRDNYTGSEDRVYTNAVAHLVYYAGAAVKMQYGLSASGAYTDDIPKGFTDYFAYDASTIQICFRTDFAQQEWNELVYQELAAGRPMIYNGTAGSGGGHSFVCDGYEYGDYYHINWGWGGMGNGYFQLAILNPRESGIGGSSSAEGYNMKQNVIIGIQPGDPAGSPTPEVVNALTATGFTTGFSGALERDSQNQGFSIYKRKSFKLNYADHVGTQKRYDVGLGLYDTDMNLVELVIKRGIYSTALTSALGSFWEFGSGIEARDAVKFGAGLIGNYYLVPLYQLEGTTEWKPMLETDRFYMDVVIDSYSATFTEHPIRDLSVTGWELEGGEKVGSPEQIHVTLHNGSADRFFGDLYLWFGNQAIDEFAEYTTSLQAEVMPGSDATVTFNVTPANAGTQTLRVSYDATGYYFLPGNGTVTVSDVVESTMNMSVVIEAVNATEGVLYDSYARFRADVTNNGTSEYNKYVIAPLFLVHKDEYGNVLGGEMVTYEQCALNVQPGETKTVYFDFYNLGYGQTYSMNLYARDENGVLVNLVQQGHSVYYDVQRGMVVWSGDDFGAGSPASDHVDIPSEAVAVRLEGLDITSVTPNDNPNTIYLLGADDAVPAGLEGCNVVLGDRAERIALKDGYPYFTPQSFTAQEVTYERIIEQGRHTGDAAGWTTIVLPFAPQTITAKGADLSLCNGEYADGDMWVERFASEVDNVPTFECVDAMQANVPYLLAVSTEFADTPIAWQASNVTLKAEPIAYTSGNVYLMAGNYLPMRLETIYVANEYEAHATLMRSATVAPFRAYFKSMVDVTDGGIIRFPGSTATPQLGDVNGDGHIDIEDVNAIINIIVESVPATHYAGNADINGDGHIDVEDVNAIINIIIAD